MTDNTITNSWRAIERWLASNAPELAQQLRGGATRDELEQAEQRLGFALPPELRECYGVHNGGGWFLLPFEDEFLSLSQVVTRWAMMNDLGFGRAEDLPNVGTAIGPVKPLWWNDRWLPLLGTSSMVCVDLDPADGGRPGQLIEFLKDDPRRRVLYDSLGSWLEHWATELESGRYYCDGDELVRSDDQDRVLAAGSREAMPTSEGTRLLRVLIDAGALELEDKGRDELQRAMDDVLSRSRSRSVRRRAAMLDELLVSHDAVAEMFWDREQLEELLEKW